jgi:fibronectin type 3 domain-containing protein
MNQHQKLSDTSAPVFIKPARSIVLPDIGGLTSYVNGNKIQLLWEDVAAHYSTVSGYIVLRREKGGDKFMVINTKIIPTAFYTDTLTDKKGTVYEYSVACMDVNGNISNMSNSVFASASVPKPMPPAKVYAVQMQGNINISWPAVAVNDNAAVSYIVYRKAVGESAFTKLSSTTKAEYIDKTAQSGKLYSYAIGTVIAGVEGNKSDVGNVRKK